MSDKKKIALPVTLGESANLHADMKLKQLGISKSSPDYKEAREEVITNFCEEALHSFIPMGSGVLGMNPYTPKIPKKFYEEMYAVMNKREFFTKLSPVDREEVERILRSMVTTMSNVILKTKYKLRVKDKGDGTDFSYSADAGYPDNIDVIENQYLRYFVSAMIMNEFEELFDNANYMSIEEAFETFMPELSYDEKMSDKARFELLNSSASRKAFFTNVFKYLRGEKPKHGSIPRQNPMSIEPKIKNETNKSSMSKFAGIIKKIGERITDGMVKIEIGLYIGKQAEIIEGVVPVRLLLDRKIEVDSIVMVTVHVNAKKGEITLIDIEKTKI